jgi:hypothetical protein
MKNAKIKMENDNVKSKVNGRNAKKKGAEGGEGENRAEIYRLMPIVAM